MKRNNVAKRFGIASLCLATALSAFSGIASQTNSVALAEGEVALADFVHTTAETVAQTTEKLNSDGSNTTIGLRLTSDVAYEGTFKTVCKGDSKLNFKFPEEYDTTTQEYYGDFRIRIADVDDQSKYFDVVYFTVMADSANKPYTGVCVEYTIDGVKQTRATHNANTLAKPTANAWYNKRVTNLSSQAAIPCFRSKENSGGKDYGVGSLVLNWEGDVLTVQRTSHSGAFGPLAVFDGTYDKDATNQGFVSKSKWGLPKISFENGYTISYSSDITTSTYYAAGKKTTTPTTTDKGTDVLFQLLATNGEMPDASSSGDFGTIYRFNREAETTIAVDDNMTQFSNTFATEDPTTEAGEVFLGWKDAEGLHATPSSGAMAENLLRKSEYEAVTIGYDTIDGASVRIDVSGGESGIRFMTTFDKNDYAAVEQYITEKGTLVAVTTALVAEKDFTIANYQDEITNGTVKKVVNTKGVFDYTAANSTTYTAYSMAITFNNIAEELLANYYTTSYSARGYLVVEYADGSTATIYTDYDADKNSRSIAQTAYNIQQANTEYASYGDDQKAIVDTYAGYYNAN